MCVINKIMTIVTSSSGSGSGSGSGGGSSSSSSSSSSRSDSFNYVLSVVQTTQHQMKGSNLYFSILGW
jgi:hypothetical protein